jgi:hypothetical protein
MGNGYRTDKWVLEKEFMIKDEVKELKTTKLGSLVCIQQLTL